MTGNQDRWNCLKNLIRMMCIDGEISGREKKFLLHAARELELDVEDWGELVQEVRQEPSVLHFSGQILVCRTHNPEVHAPRCRRPDRFELPRVHDLEQLLLEIAARLN